MEGGRRRATHVYSSNAGRRDMNDSRGLNSSRPPGERGRVVGMGCIAPASFTHTHHPPPLSPRGEGTSGSNWPCPGCRERLYTQARTIRRPRVTGGAMRQGRKTYFAAGTVALLVLAGAGLWLGREPLLAWYYLRGLAQSNEA